MPCYANCGTCEACPGNIDALKTIQATWSTLVVEQIVFENPENRFITDQLVLGW